MTIDVRALNEVSKIMKEKIGYSLWRILGKILFLVLAILSFIWGGKILIYSMSIPNYKEYQATEEMTGKVEGYVTSVEKVDKKGKLKCSVQYVVDGKEYIYTVVSTADEKPDIGEAVPMRYIPSDPSKAGVEFTSFTFTFLKGVFIAGMVFILLGVLFTILTIRNIVRFINPKKDPLEDMYS